MNKIELASYLDSTNLSQTATYDEIKQLCNDAIAYHFKSVCVNPYYVKFAQELLKNTDVLVCTVIGFPLGMNTLSVKEHETTDAINNGANEIDMVLNISFIKTKDTQKIINEVNAIKAICKNLILKVIVETSQLNPDEILYILETIKLTKADFIKTSTGYIGNGAKIEDIKVWKNNLKDSNLKIKASGGIRDLTSCMKFIDLGVDRIGTSKAVEIIKGLEE